MDLEVVPLAQSAITLFCDNSKVVVNSKEPRSHKREKHIERKYHLIREIVNRGDAKSKPDCIRGQPSRSFYKGLDSEDL